MQQWRLNNKPLMEMFRIHFSFSVPDGFPTFSPEQALGQPRITQMWKMTSQMTILWSLATV